MKKSLALTERIPNMWKLACLVCALSLGLLATGKADAQIRVLHLGLHCANCANFDGDFVITQVFSLAAVNLANFDVIYVDEHAPFFAGGFAGRENDVFNAIFAGQLCMVAEELRFSSGPASMSAVLGTPIAYGPFSGTLVLTAAGTTHPSFTGAGIPGGVAVNPAALLPFSRFSFSAFPAGATVLATDSNGAPVVVAGSLGSGGFYISGLEPLEGNTFDRTRWMHNAIHSCAVQPGIDKEIISGPEEIGIYLPVPTAYFFEIAYTGPAALIVDTVPAEFECVSPLAPTDGTATCSKKGQSGKGANRIEWNVPAGSNTLEVEIQTVASPGKGHAKKDQTVFKPTSCGPLPINDGATAFEVDENGELVLVEVVDPVTGEVTLERVDIVGPSNSLEVEAVEGTKPCVEVE